MRQPVLLDRILERARDVRLPDEVIERLRAIFSREDLVTHALNLSGCRERENRKRATVSARRCGVRLGR